MKFIGIGGRKGAGKDTVANMIQAIMGGKRDSFAAPLKKIVTELFDVPPEILNGTDKEKDTWESKWSMRDFPNQWDSHGEEGRLTARRLMQFLGTEVIRTRLGEDFWAKNLIRRHTGNSVLPVIVSDARFLNEIEILNQHGFCIRVIMGSHLGDDKHSSEASLDKITVLDPGAQPVIVSPGHAGKLSTAFAFKNTKSNPFRYVIYNNGTLDQLNDVVHDVIADAFPGSY